MNDPVSIDELADQVNRWCDEHGVSPANGQSGEQMTVRNIRYYRTLGLLDPPQTSGGQAFGDKHRLQLIAVRLLQAQGLPLRRIQQLLFGRSLNDLREIEQRGLAELVESGDVPFRPAATESWLVTPLDDEFLLVSRRGRKLDPALRDRLASLLNRKDRRPNATRRC